MIAMVDIYGWPIGEVMAQMVWDGTLYEGDVRFELVGGDPSVLEDAARLIDTQKQLRALRFRSIGERASVRGWQGFEGTTGALRISLPAVGLRLGQSDPTVFVVSEHRAVQHEQRMEEQAIE